MSTELTAGTLRGAWAAIGSGRTVTLGSVDLWLVELPLARPVLTAKGAHRSRPVVLVQLLGEAGGVPVEGWGECAALADATYDAEDAGRSFAALERWLVPELVAESARDGGRLPIPSGLEPVRRSAPEFPLAFAALEMAVADAHLRAEDRSWAAVLGVEGVDVALGAVVGQFAAFDDLVTEVRRLHRQGYIRVKIKIGPGWDVEPLQAVTRAVPGLLVQADGNGSYTKDDLGHLVGLDRFGLLCLEQPFDRADLASHRLLAGRLATPVCLDESIDSPDSARRALDTGACSVVCIKPSRLGGLGNALDLVQSCSETQVPLWMGGMFETGYARGVNTALAALPGFTWAGDLSPAGSYLDKDLVPGPELNRRQPDGVLCTVAPRGAGMGPRPDPRTVVARAAQRQSIRASHR